MAIKTTNLYEREDYKLKLKNVEALLREAKDVESQLQRAEKKVDGKYDYPSHGLLRGNFLGNFLRGNRVSAVNNNVDRAQQALLDFHANLLLFDERLANKISLPSKMSEFSSAEGKASDIAVRTNMRLKEFDITKSKRNIQSIIRRLESEKKKVTYEILKERELDQYIENDNKGDLKDSKKDKKNK